MSCGLNIVAAMLAGKHPYGEASRSKEKLK